MNTNDPQAPYGKPTERAPLLSDDEFTDVIGHAGSQSGILVRDWYEAKINSGELRVVGKVNVTESEYLEERYQPELQCSSCKAYWMSPYDDDGKHEANFCPGCGAKIAR